MKTKKHKTKKSIKQNRTESARQIAARRRIGCPGVGMFRMKELEPADYNPREIAAEALEGLSNSIRRFGCVEPIVGQSSERAATFRCHLPCERRPQSNWSYKT
ncbi:MAG TPA: ParB N-terminal domain-containing protein [Sedimentisphaerales bacterium]|nr:ParB N-terminal domain-containing protein [Sedimentisphaerales bacterium]